MIAIRNGKRMPPSGIAALITPRAVPAISRYIKPARVIINGRIAERDRPAKKIIR